MLKSSSFAKKNTKITGMYLSSSKGLKIKIFQSIAFQLLSNALVYLHRKKLKKGTYVNFQTFGKIMKVSFHNINDIPLLAKVS